MNRLVVATSLACAATALAQPPTPEDEAMGRRVQDLLHAHQADVFGCVQAANAKADGEMLVRVMVGEDQHPAKAEVLKDQSGGGSLGQCLTGKIKQWDLAPLKAEKGDQVVFPLVFKPEKLKPGEKRVLVPLSAQEVAGPQRFVVDEQTIGEPPLATLQIVSLQPNQSMPAAPLRQAEEDVLYVLDGSFKLGSETLKRGDALWLGTDQPRPPLVPLDKKPLKLLEARAHGDGKGQKVVHAADVQPLGLPGGKGSVRLLLDGTGAKLALDEMTVEAGGSAPSHKHQGSDELLLILDGRASTTVGTERVDAVAGDAVRIAANQPHAMQAVEPLRVIQVYAPAGPEQRFKEPEKAEKPEKVAPRKKGGKKVAP
jgi:mannose-6-phosphate isomerase-like protein (cupin superfamily)